MSTTAAGLPPPPAPSPPLPSLSDSLRVCRDDSFDSVVEEEGTSDKFCDEKTDELQLAALSALEERQARLAWAGEPPDGWIS